MSNAEDFDISIKLLINIAAHINGTDVAWFFQDTFYDNSASLVFQLSLVLHQCHAQHMIFFRPDK